MTSYLKDQEYYFELYDKGTIRECLWWEDNTDSNDRSLAYKGEHEIGLKDIIFIDTRVMFELAMAIIDYKMPPKDAVSILLQEGRVTFDFKKYINKDKQGND